MNSTDTMAGRDLEALRAAIAGQVFVPGEVGYDQARQGWNLAVDRAGERGGCCRCEVFQPPQLLSAMGMLSYMAWRPPGSASTSSSTP